MRALSKTKGENSKLAVNQSTIKNNKAKLSILKGISKGLGLMLKQNLSPEKSSISVN